VQQQQRQEGALLSPFQLERASLRPDFERAEDAELDVLHVRRFTTVERLLPSSGVSRT
jgi:hypothetical protein